MWLISCEPKTTERSTYPVGPLEETVARFVYGLF